MLHFYKQLFRTTFTLLILGGSLLAMPNDKVLTGYNEIIQFDKITPEYMEKASKQGREKLEKTLAKIYAIKKENRTFDNTPGAIDKAYDAFNAVFGVIYLMGSTHPDKDIRDTANKIVVELSQFDNALSLNEDLYRSYKEYSQTKEAKDLKGYKEKYVRESVRSFERNGFSLSKEKRGQLKEVNDRIAILSNQFSKNISSFKDAIYVTEAEIEGLDEAYKNARKQKDGTYKIDMTYPSYRPFMRLSTSEDARKRLMFKYLNRAKDKNLVVLEKVILNRQEMVHLLGYKTFAEYRLETRMAKNPKTVWDFENGLIEKVQEKGRKDYEEVLEVKRRITGNDTASTIYAWEAAYYGNILRKDKYKVDSEKVKEYFEINNVIDGLFKITQKLFNVTYKEIKNPSVWHESVRLFEVIDHGKVIGRFYMDLYPRDNKYGHAAAFPIIKGRKNSSSYQIPNAALVTNFPKPTESQPSLMSHGQVETFFHEFGHILHNMLTTAELSSFSGTSVSRDFVEAPSQIFENWTWDYSALKLFAKHYKTGKVLPKSLFDKMYAAKTVGSGTGTLYQIFYGLIDMNLHDKYNPNESRTTTDILKSVQKQVILTPYMEGTHFHAAFGHLMGYAASYYGYLWSNVYAQDMYSKFEEAGIMNPAIGKRYRDIILGKGGSEEAIDLVKEFLERDPNPEAFYKSLGL